jgi:hypothetical protein
LTNCQPRPAQLTPSLSWTIAILNWFQDPFFLVRGPGGKENNGARYLASSGDRAKARWILKQVQDDERRWRTIADNERIIAAAIAT